MTDNVLSLALKDWSIAIEALLSGETCLFLRKGGIRDGRPGFQIRSREALLLPNGEHQRPELVKEAFRPQVAGLTLDRSPVKVSIPGWCEIVDDVQITTLAAVQVLYRHHIWTESFAAERFGWRPSHPLHVLVIRAHRLSKPQEIAWREEYGGCRSWADLTESVSIAGSTPALSDAAFAARRDAIREDLETSLSAKERTASHATG